MLFAGLIWRVAQPDIETAVNEAPTVETVVINPEQTAQAEQSLSTPKRVELPYERETSRRGNEPEADKIVSATHPKIERFSRVIVEDTGTVVADKLTIRFSEIEPLSLAATCEGAQESWPCGRSGRGALRRLIRGRTIACTELTRIGENEVAGRCTVASTDINQWLVRHGWARPRDATRKPYGAALEMARREGRGQWR